MNRRTLIFALLLALVALAGCVHSAGRIQTVAVDDGGLAAEASESVAGPESRYSAAERRTLRAAAEDGAALANESRGPVDPDLPVAHDGAYYAVDHEARGNASGRRAEIAIDFNASDPAGDRIAFADLPTVDRVALRDALADRPDGESFLEPGPDLDLDVAYTVAEANRSVLVDGQRYDVIDYDGRAFAVSVRDRGPTTLTTYRYETTRVAADADAYASLLRREYAFALRNLSEAERDVMEKAANDSFYPGSSSHEGFDALVDRFRDHRAVYRNDEYHSGAWVARYDGQLYWVQMDYGSFVDEDGGVGEGDENRLRDSGAETPTVDATPIDAGTVSAGGSTEASSPDPA